MRSVCLKEKSVSFPYKILTSYFTMDETEKVKTFPRTYRKMAQVQD